MTKYFFVFALMLITSISGYVLKPTDLLVNHNHKVELANAIPNAFGDWQLIKDTRQTIIEPEQEALINKLYSQTYSQTFVNKSSGERVMLSLAYGETQTDGKEVHKPDICYPAQGFSISDINKTDLPIEDGKQKIHANQLVARMNNRVEPIIYWTTLGTHTYNTRLQKKSIEFKYALKNMIPDGMLFRVSIIDSDPDKGNLTLRGFIKDLYLNSQDEYKQRIFGTV